MCDFGLTIQIFCLAQPVRKFIVLQPLDTRSLIRQNWSSFCQPPPPWLVWQPWQDTWQPVWQAVWQADWQLALQSVANAD
jgi:hypothetical protein